MATQERILQYMREDAYKPLTIEELVSVLKIKKDEIGSFSAVIDEMEKAGYIVKTRRGRYGIPEKMNLVVGRLHAHQRGFGFIIPDNPEIQDVFIPADGMNGAMHNDRVIARISGKSSAERSYEGEIIRILYRANKEIVGCFEKNKNFGFVKPDDPRIHFDIFIPGDEMNGAKTGQKVIVEILKWAEKRRNPEGRIIEILGRKDKPGIDILSIIKKHNLPESFQYEVIQQAEKIPETIREVDLKGRIDLRDHRIVTIDGEDAKDLDDAVSVQLLENGHYLLGVHIADVGYYVPENTPLDMEARKRGCSVYLVDRVIPMLPPKLSNNICSLNPGMDRLTISVFIEIDKTGKVVNYDIKPSVIRSSERMTYNNVTKILEGSDPELLKRYDYLLEDFRNMKDLCNILIEKRKTRGSIDFELYESKVILDEEGKAVDIIRKERTLSDQIIEEFMLICNEVVAEHMYWLNIPFVYRVHEKPDPEKILILKNILHNLGYSVSKMREIKPKTLQEILNKVKGEREEKVINMMLLRSLKQARYSEINLGHFGLAVKYYSHFTAPIRRYPDLVIHRIIREQIQGKMTQGRQKYLNKIISNIAKEASERERIAEEAERESVDLKKVEYMEDKIGFEFDGIISGLTSFGMFVELENTVEGLVHVSNMLDDYYIFYEDQLIFQGERTNKTYRIGDPVTVRVIKVSKELLQIDFELVE